MSKPPDKPQDPDQVTDNSQKGTKPLNPKQSDSSGESSPVTILRPAGEGQETQPFPRGDTSRIRLVPRIPNPPPWRIIFLITQPVRATLGLDVRQSIVIGRIDADEVDPADVDLSAYHAADFGVSRQHTGLIPGHDALYMVDLDSTNGTWINGVYLQPGQRYEINTGDLVEFGLMKLEVRSVVQLRR